MSLNMLIEACCRFKNNLYGYIGPTYKQTKAIAVTDPMMLRHYLPEEVCEKPFNESELTQRFITNSTLLMKGADDPDSIRGIGFKGVVLEEWAMMKYGRVIWEEILEPVLRENGGWAAFIFTPKGRNFAYEYLERAKRDITGDWHYSILKASQSGIIDPQELLKAKQEMPERLYQQEFECAFLEDASSVFHNVDGCIAGSFMAPVLGRRYIMGVDLGRTHDFTVLTVIDIGTNHVVAHERFSQTAWDVQKHKIVLLAKVYNNAKIFIDATGFSAGSVIAEDLKKIPIVEDLKQCRLAVDAFKFTGPSKKALVDKLTVVIEQKLITFPNVEALADELKAFTYEVTPLGNIRYTAPEGMFDDCVMSLGLAVWGLGSFVYASLKKLPLEKAGMAKPDYGRGQRQVKVKKGSLANWQPNI